MDDTQTLADLFARLLVDYERVAITGPPCCGKTSLARTVLNRPIVHGDTFQDLEWSEASRALVDAVNAIAGPVVVEGTAVPRALRKGMRVDCVLLLEEPWFALTAGQRAMGKAVRTVLMEWKATCPSVPIFTAPPRQGSETRRGVP